MFNRKRSVNRKKLEHKLYLAREDPEPIFDLSECDLIHVPTGIFSLCKVFLKEHLNLQSNQLCSLSGGGNLADLHFLKILNLQNNEFVTLPEDISCLKNLQELYVNNNQLKKLPESVCHLTYLKILNAANNALKVLPQNLGELKSLQILDVRGNKNLRHLPKNLYKAQTMKTISLDAENFIFPPTEVCLDGTEDILRYLCHEQGVPYEVSSEVTGPKDEQDSPIAIYTNEDNRFEEKIRTLEQKKQQKIQEFLEIEKQNEILQRQELELATAQKLNREKLIAAITEEQSKFESKINEIQHQKEIERNKLIAQLHKVEQNADVAIYQLLALNREPQSQFLELEKQEEEKLLDAVNRYNVNLKKDEILCAMQNILHQETEQFLKYDKDRVETSRTILEEELEKDDDLSKILRDRDLQKSELLEKLMIDDELQKAAVGTLLERGDARSWALLQKVRLVESQLTALTSIELDRKKLNVDKHLNDLAEKRINLSNLLTELLEQQKERRCQLLTTIKTIENYNEESEEDFWLKQYQKLLEKLPEGLSQAQKNIDTRLAEALLINGVIDCLPFLASLIQKQCSVKDITEEKLLEVGITSKTDRNRILDAFHIYTKEKNLAVYEEHAPSAPALEEASAPLLEDLYDTCFIPEDLKIISTLECVVCMELECQVIFMPCGHTCCCSTCSNTLLECPLCRSAITRKLTKTV